MGGRKLPDGTIAITNMDHGDANALRGAILTQTNPVAIATQVKAAMITEVSDVAIDDRLFGTTDLDKLFVISLIVINDDQIDITIIPAAPGNAQLLAIRPQTAA